MTELARDGTKRDHDRLALLDVFLYSPFIRVCDLGYRGSRVIVGIRSENRRERVVAVCF